MMSNLFRTTALCTSAAVSLSLAHPVQAGTWTQIPNYFDPGTGNYAQPFAINDAGWIAGSIFDPTSFNSVGFLRDPSGVYTTFSVAADTEVRGIDNNNRVVGASFNGVTGNFDEFSRAADGSVTWLSNPGTGLLLHGIAQGQNSSGAIVGDYLAGASGVAPPRDAYILNGSNFTDLSAPGSDLTKARGINDKGVVVGYEATGGFDSGFIYDNGVWTTYDHPGATGGTEFEGINDKGLIVGQWMDFDAFGDPVFHSFFYNPATGNTHELVAPDEPPQFPFNQAFSINNHDQIVVISYDSWLFSADLPEPGTWAMMLMGIGGLGAVLRRRTRMAHAI